MRPYVLIAALVFPLAAAAQQVEPKATRVAGDTIEWVDAAAAGLTLPEGAKVALLEGFPQMSAPFTIRVQLPASRKIGPYAALGDERITVLSGSVKLTTTSQSGAVYGAGSFLKIPVSLQHTIEVMDAAVIQVSAYGPWPVPPAGPLTSFEATLPTSVAGLSLTVQSIDPPAHAIVDPRTVVHATLRYSVENFQPGRYLVVPMVELTSGGTSSPMRDGRAGVDLDRAEGTLTFEIPLGDVISDHRVKKPIRMWFFLNRRTGENRSRPELRTPTIDYITQ